MPSPYSKQSSGWGATYNVAGNKNNDHFILNVINLTFDRRLTKKFFYEALKTASYRQNPLIKFIN